MALFPDFLGFFFFFFFGAGVETSVGFSVSMTAGEVLPECVIGVDISETVVVGSLSVSGEVGTSSIGEIVEAIY